MGNKQSRKTKKEEIENLDLIPEYSTQITKNWLEHKLQNNEKLNLQNTKIKTFKFEAGTSAGDNFQGIVEKLHIELEDSKELDFICKFLHYNLQSKNYTVKFGGHVREHGVYSDLIPELNKFQEEHASNKYKIRIAELYFGAVEQENMVLIMEDLLKSDYHINSKFEGVNVEHSNAALEKLAILHGVSYAYSTKFDLLEKYPYLAKNKHQYLMLKELFEIMLGYVIALLKSLPEDHKLLVEKLQKLTKLGHIAEEFLLDDEPPFISCLIHHDYWSNNLLFKEIDGEIDVAMIDWQTPRLGNPVFDLLYFLHSSLKSEIRSKHIDDFLSTYHKKFCEVTTHFNCFPEIFTLEKIKEEYNSKLILGVCWGIVIPQITLSNHLKKISGANTKIPSKLEKTIQRRFIKMFDDLEGSGTRAIAKSMMKLMYSGIQKEMVSGKNPELSDRSISLVKEIDENKSLDRLINSK